MGNLAGNVYYAAAVPNEVRTIYGMPGHILLNLKEMELHHTHSFMCLPVSTFPKGQHLSLTAKSLAQECPLKDAAVLLLVVFGFGGYH